MFDDMSRAKRDAYCRIDLRNNSKYLVDNFQTLFSYLSLQVYFTIQNAFLYFFGENTFSENGCGTGQVTFESVLIVPTLANGIKSSRMTSTEKPVVYGVIEFR